MATHKFLFLSPEKGSPISINTPRGCIRGVSGEVLELEDEDLQKPMVQELLAAGDAGAQNANRLERVESAPQKEQKKKQA